MDLSIIIAMYNVEGYISNCLDSLINQGLSVKQYEVLVVNDGSTDNSAKIARRYERVYPQIKVFDQENQGQAAARNRGIELAKGDYLHFLDSDDYLAYNTLSFCICLMKEHRLDILGLGQRHTSRLDLFQSENYPDVSSEKLNVMDGIAYIANNKHGNESTWYIVRRTYLINLGVRYPVGRFVEDAVFTAKLIGGCSRIARSSLDFYRYVVRSDSTMNKTDVHHTLKMIADYEQNVFDFEEYIKRIKEESHPELKDCVERLESRQQSFVFFLLVKCIKCKTSKKQIKPILDRLSSIGAYPMDKFNKKDYTSLTYKTLTRIMNNKKLLFAIMRVLSIVNIQNSR